MLQQLASYIHIFKRFNAYYFELYDKELCPLKLEPTSHNKGIQ